MLVFTFAILHDIIYISDLRSRSLTNKIECVSKRNKLYFTKRKEVMNVCQKKACNILLQNLLRLTNDIIVLSQYETIKLSQNDANELKFNIRIIIELTQNDAS